MAVGHPTALAVVCLLGASAVGEAQRWEVDLSGTRTAFETDTAVSSASIVPWLEWRTRNWFATATVAATTFHGGGWSAQGSADGSYFLAPGGSSARVAAELLGVVRGSYQSNGLETFVFRAEPRAHLVGRRAGLWLGAVATGGWNSRRGDILEGFGPTVGVWARRGRARAAFTVTPLRLSGAWQTELDGFLAVTAGPLDAVGYAGWHSGTSGSGFEDEAWAGVSASWWFGLHTALMVSGGSYGPDVLRGFSSGRYLSAGFRFTGVRPTIPALRPPGRPVYERREGDRLQLRFRVSDATSVAIAGDWTEWERVPMTRADGDTWQVVLSVPPGVHRFNLVVDGERWIVPEGVPVVDDGFGGRAGLLMVP